MRRAPCVSATANAASTPHRAIRAAAPRLRMVLSACVVLQLTVFDNPHTYYVDLSQKLWEIKYRLLKDNACGEHHA